jgi:hypothetical protein
MLRGSEASGRRAAPASGAGLLAPPRSVRNRRNQPARGAGQGICCSVGSDSTRQPRRFSVASTAGTEMSCARRCARPTPGAEPVRGTRVTIAESVSTRPEADHRGHRRHRASDGAWFGAGDRAGSRARPARVSPLHGRGGPNPALHAPALPGQTRARRAAVVERQRCRRACRARSTGSLRLVPCWIVIICPGTVARDEVTEELSSRGPPLHGPELSGNSARLRRWSASRVRGPSRASRARAIIGCNFSRTGRHLMSMTFVGTRKRCRHLVPLLVALGCGSSDSNEPPAPSSGGAPSTPMSPMPSPLAPPNPNPGLPPEAVAAVTDALGMAADQLQAACGTTFDECSATPGCNEILACAARSGCTGSACYCADTSCETDGPCRSVIEGAQGARVPDEADSSLGPAADAAAAVGDCLGGLAGGLRPTPPTPASSGVDGGDSSDGPDAG